MTDLILYAIALGIGATIFMDVVAIVLKKTLGVPSLNYSLVGRWIAYFPKGRFIHKSIAEATPMKGETVIGWIAHYTIGIIFAFIMILCWGQSWVLAPSAAVAVGYGMLTTMASWLLMQPAFGQGFAASKIPTPWISRLRSLATHAIYGLGIYLSGLGLLYASSFIN